MNKLYSLAAAIALMAAIAALSPRSALAQNENYVLTNNDPSSVANSTTLFKLDNKTLNLIKTVQTGGNGGGGGDFALDRIILTGNGTNRCLFVGDAGSSDIASFQFPSFAKVGNYTDPEGDSDGFGYSMGLAARGALLFAAYGITANIGVFEIETGCTLSLLGTYNAAGSVAGMRVAPDGKTLVVGYGYGANLVDSFAISSKGALKEGGPYPALNGPAGVDVTSDSKYAVFGDATGSTTQIEIFPIDSDGKLGTETSFGGDGSLGAGVDSSSVWISPNEKFLYVSNNLSTQVTSLAFSESPLDISYVGITTLNDSGEIISIGGLTTAVSSGNGGAIYVAEFSSPDGLVGLLLINSDGTTTEATGSPFTNGESSALLSLAAYPQRSF
jgi:hypothetical protein